MAITDEEKEERRRLEREKRRLEAAANKIPSNDDGSVNLNAFLDDPENQSISEGFFDTSNPLEPKEPFKVDEQDLIPPGMRTPSGQPGLGRYIPRGTPKEKFTESGGMDEAEMGRKAWEEQQAEIKKKKVDYTKRLGEVQGRALPPAEMAEGIDNFILAQRDLKSNPSLQNEVNIINKQFIEDLKQSYMTETKSKTPPSGEELKGYFQDKLIEEVQRLTRIAGGTAQTDSPVARAGRKRAAQVLEAYVGMMDALGSEGSDISRMLPNQGRGLGRALTLSENERGGGTIGVGEEDPTIFAFGTRGGLTPGLSDEIEPELSGIGRPMGLAGSVADARIGLGARTTPAEQARIKREMENMRFGLSGPSTGGAGQTAARKRRQENYDLENRMRLSSELNQKGDFFSDLNDGSFRPGRPGRTNVITARGNKEVPDLDDLREKAEEKKIQEEYKRVASYIDEPTKLLADYRNANSMVMNKAFTTDKQFNTDARTRIIDAVNDRAIEQNLIDPDKNFIETLGDIRSELGLTDEAFNEHWYRASVRDNKLYIDEKLMSPDDLSPEAMLAAAALTTYRDAVLNNFMSKYGNQAEIKSAVRVMKTARKAASNMSGTFGADDLWYLGVTLAPAEDAPPPEEEDEA